MKIIIDTKHFAEYLKHLLSEKKGKSLAIFILQDHSTNGIAIEGINYSFARVIDGEEGEGVELKRKQLKELQRILRAISFQQIILSIDFADGIRFHSGIKMLGAAYELTTNKISYS